jgi:hypothetical protein
VTISVPSSFSALAVYLFTIPRAIEHIQHGSRVARPRLHVRRGLSRYPTASDLGGALGSWAGARARLRIWRTDSQCAAGPRHCWVIRGERGR